MTADMTTGARHILVAEDNAAMAGVIRYNLEKAGFEVTLARCGKTAWQLLESQSFDLVVTDFQMPGITGGELCQRIRQDERLAQLPVILLTAKGLELDLSWYKDELGVSDVMAKPFSPRELTLVVQQHLAVETSDT